jgi:hypothetical protein
MHQLPWVELGRERERERERKRERDLSRDSPIFVLEESLILLHR